MRTSRPPIDSKWLDERLRELERLVAAGDTLEVVAKLGELVREPKRESVGKTDGRPAAAAAEPAADTVF